MRRRSPGSRRTPRAKPRPSTFFHPEALADYLAAARTPEIVGGMCRAPAPPQQMDLQHDRASRAAGHKVQCPLMVLWGSKGKIGQWYDGPAIWRAILLGSGDRRRRRQRPLPGRGGAGRGGGAVPRLLRLTSAPGGLAPIRCDNDAAELLCSLGAFLHSWPP